MTFARNRLEAGYDVLSYTSFSLEAAWTRVHPEQAITNTISVQANETNPPNRYCPSLIDVNIFGSDNTNSTWFPSKHIGPDSTTHRYDATIATTKRDYAFPNKLSFVSSPTSNTIACIPIQAAAPPLSKMGQDATNDPYFPGANRNVQGRSLLCQH